METYSVFKVYRDGAFVGHVIANSLFRAFNVAMTKYSQAGETDPCDIRVVPKRLAS